MSANPCSGRFHHIGVASRAIEKDVQSFAPLGYALASEIIDDPGLGIRCALLEGAGPRLELVSDLEGSAFVRPWLTKGVKYYHLAFEVGDIEASCRQITALGAKIIQGPRPARLFAGRPVAFAMLRSMALIEYIQEESYDSAK